MVLSLLLGDTLLKFGKALNLPKQSYSLNVGGNINIYEIATLPEGFAYGRLTSKNTLIATYPAR